MREFSKHILGKDSIQDNEHSNVTDSFKGFCSNGAYI